MSRHPATFPRFPSRRIGFALATLVVTASLDNLPLGRVGDAPAAGSLTLVSKAYHDLDGDRDIVPDTGESVGHSIDGTSPRAMLQLNDEV